MRGQRENIRRTMQQPGIVEFPHGLLAHTFDIEGAARAEMNQPLDNLRRAGEAAGAAAHHIIIHPHGE